MILLHIGTRNEEQAYEIVDFLIDECLIFDVRILNSIDVESSNGKLVRSDSFLILGKTKALLFQTIDKVLQEKYKKEPPSVYSVPIVNMNWEEATKLKDHTVKV